MVASRLAWIAIAGVVGLLVAGFAAYFAVNADDSSGSPEGTGTPPATVPTELPTTPPASTPTADETPAETPPVPTEPLPTEPPATLTSIFVDCGGPRNRVNVEKLSAQPQLADATITPVDSDTVEIDIQGFQFYITGWGESSTLGDPGHAPQELFERVVAAIDAVLHEC